jgi:ABC-type transport system involved in cytochrome c biogenesis permease subunit
MNIKLIFILSLVGLAMAVASVFGWTKEIEPLLWLIIFIIYAIIIAYKTTEKRFLNGFLVSLLNGIWIAIIHCIFFLTYLHNNPQMLDAYHKMPHFASPRIMQLVFGPFIGALTGLILGLFAFIAGKIIKKGGK